MLHHEGYILPTSKKVLCVRRVITLLWHEDRWGGHDWCHWEQRAQNRRVSRGRSQNKDTPFSFLDKEKVIDKHLHHFVAFMGATIPQIPRAWLYNAILIA